MNKEIIASLDQIDQVANYLVQIIPDNAIIFLIGNLAAGKTTLTSRMVKAKGITSTVTSPTFSLQNCYGDQLYHYDLYRIEHQEFMDLGLFEEFEKTGWHLVEWGSDELKEFLLNVGYELYTISIEPIDNKRKYTIEKNS